jgi:hypothetical protein
MSQGWMMIAKQVWHISKINAFSLDMLYNSLIQLLLRNRAIASVGFAEEKNTPRVLLFSNVYSSLVAIVNLSLCQIRGDEQNTACLDLKLSR